MNFMKLTYFDTLHKRESTMNITGEIEFKDGEIHFASSGHRYSIRTEYIVKIETLDD